MSRLHVVVGPAEDGRVEVDDLDGRRLTVSLLAYEGSPPEVGDWLVAQSGFALAPADPSEAEAALSELRALEDRERR
ncbi:MAG TPA: hypothetical protein VMR97_03905 [Acidimicrobiales bacterium]|nr:hypothetical protein [Acidimicrobiales bacterium]